ncbi:MAG: hypothetical protein GXP63_07060 [DPANN group archaeon]|nr:hypothetical protein [DPANN group archaeon]
MDEILTTTLPFGETFNLKKLLGVRVIASNGLIVGKVSQLRVDPKTAKLEGIMVRHGLFRRIYIDTTYFQKINPASIILAIEPCVLLKGRKVITAEGEVVGTVRAVERKELTNDIKEVVVKPFLKKSFVIPVASIRSFGASLILRPSYHVEKKKLWRPGL